MEQFYSVLKELAEKCDFENREEVIIRDIFVTNMLDDDMQRELLRDKVEPKGNLSIAVNMEMGRQNQQEYRPTTTTATQLMQYNSSVNFAAQMLE